jgi:hypothetical protein
MPACWFGWWTSLIKKGDLYRSWKRTRGRKLHWFCASSLTVWTEHFFSHFFFLTNYTFHGRYKTKCQKQAVWLNIIYVGVLSTLANLTPRTKHDKITSSVIKCMCMCWSLLSWLNKIKDYSVNIIGTHACRCNCKPFLIPSETLLLFFVC